MGILPVINCINLESVKQTIQQARTFLPEGSFLHCDIADASISFNKTWNNPQEWLELRAPYHLEVHLMVEHPERQVDDWIRAGARRFVVQLETLTDVSLMYIFDACDKQGIGVSLSTYPETTTERLGPYLKHFSLFQVLAVHPGLAGQQFLPLTLEKIAWIRRERPSAIIEVDGGMNPETAKLAKEAGADFIVSSNYIFGSQDPHMAYEALKAV